MRVRTQFNYSDEELLNLYRGYDHTQWPDHKYRINTTLGILKTITQQAPILKVCDLGFGDGSLIHELNCPYSYGCDLAEGNYRSLSAYAQKINSHRWEFHNDSIDKYIEYMPDVDLVIMSEVIEHLQDPDTILSKLRNKTQFLFVSTPLDETPGTNPEHYWSWGDADILQMFQNARFDNIIIYNELHTNVSRFQLWLVT